MFYSIEVSGVNTSFVNDIICGEFASLANLRSDAWYTPSVMRDHAQEWNRDNPDYKLICLIMSHPYGLRDDGSDDDMADMRIVLPSGRKITFILADDGKQYSGGAVGTLTIDFGERGSGHLALNILQNLEYYGCLDQIESIKTSLPFIQED